MKVIPQSRTVSRVVNAIIRLGPLTPLSNPHNMRRAQECSPRTNAFGGRSHTPVGGECPERAGLPAGAACAGLGWPKGVLSERGGAGTGDHARASAANL